MFLENKNQESGQTTCRRQLRWLLLSLSIVLSVSYICWLSVVLFPELAFSAASGRRFLAFGFGVTFSLLLVLVIYGGIFSRKRLEALVGQRTRSLKRTVDLYERLGRASKTFSLYILPDSTILAVSSSVFDILGYTPEEMCGKKMTHFYPSGDWKNFHEQNFEDFHQREAVKILKQPMLSKGGEILWFVINLVPETRGDSGEKCLHATCSDVTEAHEVEITLQKSEQRYKSLTEDISDIIWEINAATRRLVYISPSVFRHLGVQAEEIVGRTVDECGLLITPDVDSRKMDELSKRFQSGEAEACEEFFSPRKALQHRDGRDVYLESVYRFSRSEETGQIIVRGVSRNVTNKFRLEVYNNLRLIALQTLAKPGYLHAILTDLAQDICRVTGITSVGIRLAAGNDYPYIATAGFDPDEVRNDNSLFIHQDGHLLRAENGKPQLRCLCGEVLEGTKCSLWPRTPYGTMWTNDFTGTFLKDCEGLSIPVCAHRGYRSMAIVPIRVRDELVGLLKLNSTEKDEFNEDIVAVIESLVFHIGESIDRRKVHNYYSLLFDGMSEAVIVAERQFDEKKRLTDLLVVSVNPAFSVVFGMPESAVVQKLLSETLPSVYERVRDDVDEAIQQGRQVHCGFHDTTLARDLEMTLFPVGTTEFALIASDVTEKTETEQSLQESRRQYAALISNIPGIVYRCHYDHDWTMLFISEGSEEVIGYTPDDFYDGKITFNDIVEKRFRGPIRARWKDVLAEQALFNMEYGIIAKDGERKWVIERGGGIFDADGKLVALEGIIFDITERKIAEQGLERFATAIEQSRDAVIITNENGVILNANAAIEPLTGYGKQEIVGRVMAEFESPPIDSELYHSMWKTLYLGKTWEANFPNRRKDGTLYTENVVVSPVMGDTGQVQNFVCLCRDVTQELKDQEERESLRGQLNQATKMESVGRLAGGIAHDFNNMLQAILGYAEMALLQIPAEHSAYDDIRFIQSAANRAADLTKQLLVFARRSKKTLTVFGVSETIGNLMALLRGIIEPQARLEWLPSEAETNIKADRSQFEQAVTNLCINARDAVEGNTMGTLKIAIERQTFTVPHVTLTDTIPAGIYASVIVTDNGCGMSSESLTQMFDPFFTTKAKGKGTGLGLAMVYGIIKSCGGGILVESSAGKGTRVELLFPESTEMITGDDEVSTSEPPRKRMPRGDGETVLVVDDEETILLTTQRMLESIGYVVLATTSPLEAITIAKAKGNNLSLLLSDVIMPEMNGPQMVGQILDFLPDLPYLYMSGYTANLLEEQGVPKRSNGNIHKPFTRAELAEKIRKGLDRVQKKVKN